MTRRRQKPVVAAEGALDASASEADKSSDRRERIQSAVDECWRFGMTLQELIDALRQKMENGHSDTGG
jgi:DNA-binding transcriptional regulator YhcF (GntR family)